MSPQFLISAHWPLRSTGDSPKITQLQIVGFGWNLVCECLMGLRRQHIVEIHIPWNLWWDGPQICSRGLFDCAKLWYRVWSCHSRYTTSANPSPKYPYHVGNRGRRLQRRLRRWWICRLVHYRPRNWRWERLVRRRASFRLQCIAIATFLVFSSVIRLRHYFIYACC